MVCQDLNGHPGVIADERREYGWFMWVPEDVAEHVDQYNAEDPEHPIPEPIVAIWHYAQQHDCSYVLLDRDAGVNPDLPTWEW